MIKAYTVHRYWLCQITGEVIAQISFAIGDENVACEKVFPTQQFANDYIYKSKRDWFLMSLEKFVNHKKQIIEANADATKQNALQVCLNAYNDFITKGLDTISKRFLSGKTYFESILPHSNNASHKGSREALNELIKFCETETKTIKP